MLSQRNLIRSNSEVIKSKNCEKNLLKSQSPPQAATKECSNLQPIIEESDFKSSDGDCSYSSSSPTSSPHPSQNESKSKTQILSSQSDSFDEVLAGAFRSGPLRNKSIKLTYVDKQTSQYSAESPEQLKSDDALSVFVAKQASSLGLDPEIFLSSQSGSGQEAPPAASQASSVQSCLQVPEVIEIASILRSAKSASSQQQPQKELKFSQSGNSSSQCQSEKPFLEISFSENPNTIHPGSNSKPNLAKADANVLQSVMKENQKLQDAMIKQNLQVSILQYYLKAQKQDEDKRVEALNNAIRVLSSHEVKLREISQRTYSEAQKLHFAFLFASPLVISGKRQHQQIEKKIYKLMPPLNFQKEFLKIKDSVDQAQVCFRITKRQCTSNTLNEILAKNPMGIHFSGHGLLNTEKELGTELYNMYQGQGNFLLLETEDGGGSLVSTQTLKRMIMKNYGGNHQGLQLVVVATCHSEFVGQIFQEAGVQHVVCIHQQYEVEDDAIITFTDSFYGLLFDQKKICDAFEQATMQVALAHSEQQASIFKLLKHENSESYKKRKSLQQKSFNSINQSQNRRNQYLKALSDSSEDQTFHKLDQISKSCSMHQCGLFGPFENGQMSFVEPVNISLKNMAPLQTTLVGRAKDQFKLIQHIVSNKASRLIALTGMPGVGKSSLILRSLQWIHERSLLRGGSIYQNARDINCCAVFTRKLCIKLVTENPKLFQSVSQLIDCNKQPMKALKLIMTKLIRIEHDILLVIDNAEDLIQNDKTNFRKLVSYFLQLVPSMKVLLTSRVLLYFAAEFKEESICLQGLKEEQAAGLFLKMTRVIEQDETNRLLDTIPDFERFPMERMRPIPYKLHEHHLFRLLNGNPQSIILTAPVLSDPERCIDLPKLYITMTSNKIQHLLRDVEVENRMLGSLRMSAQVSIQHFIDTGSQSLDLFFLLGMLPAGIAEPQLDYLWRRLQKRNSFGNNKNEIVISSDELTVYSARLTADNNDDGEEKVTSAISIGLKRALNELYKAKIASRSIRKQPQSKIIDSNNRKETTLISMPEYIRNFSEGLIEEEMHSDLNTILAQWLEKVAYYKFIQCCNTETSDQTLADLADEERFDKNVGALIQRQVQDDRDNENAVLKPQQQKSEERSVNKSVMTVAFETHDKVFDDYSEEEQSSCLDNPFLRDILDKEMHEEDKQQDLPQSTKLQPMKKMSKKNSRRVSFLASKKDGNQNWHELHEAVDLVAKTHTKRQTKDRRHTEMHHPRVSAQKRLELTNNTSERAKLNWRKLFDRSIQQGREDKDKALGNMNTIGGMLLEEESDWSDSESGELSKSELIYSSKKLDESINNQEQEAQQNQACAPVQRLKDAMRIRYKDTFDQIDFNLARFQRGSIRSIRVVNVNQVGSSNCTPRQRNSTVLAIAESNSMSVQEKAMIYHLATKALAEDYRVVLMIIKKSIVHLYKSSMLFKGNVRRLQAYCLMQELKAKHSASTHVWQMSGKLELSSQKELEIEDALNRAQASFEIEGCAWGIGLTCLQQAVYYAYKLKNLNSFQGQSNEKHKPTARNLRAKMAHSRSKSSELFIQMEQSRIQEEAAEILSSFHSSLEVSITQLKKVSHYRALAHAFKLLADVTLDTKSFAKQMNNQDSFIDNSDSDLVQDARQEQADYTQKYRQACQSNPNELTKDLRIVREQGEEISIFTEIVLSPSNNDLFHICEQATPFCSKVKMLNKQLNKQTSFVNPKGSGNSISFANATLAMGRSTASARNIFKPLVSISPDNLSKVSSINQINVQKIYENQANGDNASLSFNSETQFQIDVSKNDQTSHVENLSSSQS